jgi:hypothetical protein
MSLLESLGDHFRSLFASWFPRLDEYPGAQDERAFFESEVEKALTELGYAERALHQGLNGLAVGVTERRVKDEMLGGVQHAVTVPAAVWGKVQSVVNPPPPIPRGWQLPPELRPPLSVFWMSLGFGWYLFCLYLFFSSRPTAFSSPLPVMIGTAIACSIAFLPQFVAWQRWRAGKLPRNYFADAYSVAPVSLRLFIEETLAGAAAEIEEVGRRIRHEVYALPIGAANEPVHRELAERLAEAGAALAEAAAEFEEITGRKVVLGVVRSRDRDKRPFDRPRHFEESTIRAMLTDLELMARRGLAAIRTVSPRTDAQVAPDAARHVAEFTAQLERVRARLTDVIGRSMRAARGAGTEEARKAWDNVQGVAESAIPEIVSDLEIAARRLRSEFNAAAAGAANREALAKIAAALTRCLAETDAAQAKLRALTGRD